MAISQSLTADVKADLRADIDNERFGPREIDENTGPGSRGADDSMQTVHSPEKSAANPRDPGPEHHLPPALPDPDPATNPILNDLPTKPGELPKEPKKSDLQRATVESNGNATGSQDLASKNNPKSKEPAHPELSTTQQGILRTLV